MANKGDKLPTQLIPETVAKDSPVNLDQSQETLQEILYLMESFLRIV